MTPAKVHIEQMGSVEKELLGSAPLADLQAHFNNPENKRRFKEWQETRKTNTIQNFKEEQ